jgi:hypothetical protein
MCGISLPDAVQTPVASAVVVASFHVRERSPPNPLEFGPASTGVLRPSRPLKVGLVHPAHHRGRPPLCQLQTPPHTAGDAIGVSMWPQHRSNLVRPRLRMPRKCANYSSVQSGLSRSPSSSSLSRVAVQHQVLRPSVVPLRRTSQAIAACAQRCPGGCSFRSPRSAALGDCVLLSRRFTRNDEPAMGSGDL